MALCLHIMSMLIICAVMDNFGFLMAETSRLLRREFDRRATALGVTRAQWRVLVRLRHQDGVRQVNLADALDVEPITLCRMIDRLSEAGLVERRRDEADRRAWRVFLTPKASPLMEKLHVLGEAFLADALEGVSEEEQQRVLDTLAVVRANLSKTAVAAEPERKVS